MILKHPVLLLLQGKVDDMERKYSDLLSLSEKLNEDLESKNESIVVLKEKIKSIVVDKENSAKFREADIQALVYKSTELKAQLKKALDDLDAMTTKMENASYRNGVLNEKLVKVEKDRDRLKELNKAANRKIEELNDMLSAMSKSKHLAVDEIRTKDANVEALKKTVESLKSRLHDKEKDNEKLLKRIIEEKEVMMQENNKAQAELAERNRSLRARVEMYEERFERKFSEKKPKSESEPSKIAHLERLLVDMKNELKATADEHTMEIARLRTDLHKTGSLNSEMSNDPLNSYVIENALNTYEYQPVVQQPVSIGPLLTEIVTHRADSDVLKQPLLQPEVITISDDDEEDKKVELVEVDSPIDLSLGGQVEDLSQWVHKETRKVNEDREAEEEMKALGEWASQPRNDNDMKEPDDELKELADWVSQTPPSRGQTLEASSAASSTRGQRIVEVSASEVDSRETSLEAPETVVQASAPEPVIEPMVPEAVSREASVEYSNSFVLTDDGRTVSSSGDENNDRLPCPLCEVAFEAGQVRALEIHVDSHLASSRACPICQQTFGVDEVTDLEAHVQAHFDNEDYSMLGNREEAEAARCEQRRQNIREDSRPREDGASATSTGPFGINLETMTNAVRNWTLDID